MGYYGSEGFLWVLIVIGFVIATIWAFYFGSPFKLSEDSIKRDRWLSNLEKKCSRSKLTFLDLNTKDLLSDAKSQMENNKFENAVEPLLMARKISPGNFEVHWLLARAFKKLHFRDKAKEEYLQARKLIHTLPEEEQKKYIDYLREVVKDFETGAW